MSGSTASGARASAAQNSPCEHDVDTRLQYKWARWYDAEVGRWISEDPIGFAAGDANVTRYVGNHAPNSTDPSGYVSLIDFIPVLGPGNSAMDSWSNGNKLAAIGWTLVGAVDFATFGGLAWSSVAIKWGGGKILQSGTITHFLTGPLHKWHTAYEVGGLKLNSIFTTYFKPFQKTVKAPFDIMKTIYVGKVQSIALAQQPVWVPHCVCWFGNAWAHAKGNFHIWWVAPKYLATPILGAGEIEDNSELEEAAAPPLQLANPWDGILYFQPQVELWEGSAAWGLTVTDIYAKPVALDLNPLIDDATSMAADAVHAFGSAFDMFALPDVSSAETNVTGP